MPEKSDPPALPRRSPGAFAIVFLWVSPLLCGLLGFLAAAVIAYVLPKKFESTCVLQLRGATQLHGEGGIAEAPPSSQFIETEVRVIQSEGVLAQAAEHLDLSSRWNQDPLAVRKILEGIVTVDVVPGTDLVELRVRHTSREEAAEIARAITGAYLELRNRAGMERAEKALTALDAELEDQVELVEEKRKALYTIAEAVGIPHHRENDPSGLEGEFALGAERELFKLEDHLQALRVQSKMLQQLEDEELYRYAASLKIPQNPTAELLARHEEALEVAKELETSGMGLNHPKARAQAAAISSTLDDLTRAVAVLQLMLDTELEVSTARAEELRSVIDKRRELAVERAVESPEYIEAKRDYENARDMREQMEQMHAKTRIDLKVPRSSVTIHEQPREGRAPVSPKVGPILITGGVGGMAVGLTLGLLVFVLAGRRR